MKKLKFSFLFLIACITVNTAVFSAPQRRGRSSTISTKNFRGTLQNNNLSMQNTITISSPNDNMICGIAPSTTNNLAKRKCAIAYSEGLKEFCKTYPCTSKIKVELSFSFALPNLTSIATDINGINCNGENLDKFCSPFSSSLLDGLWDLYSEQTIRERKNCNFAKAKYTAAQDCFMYIQAEKNNSVGNIFNAKKITKLDKGIDEKCGHDAILNKYKNIAIDEWTKEDENKFFKGSKINSDGLIEGTDAYQGKKELSSTVASLFANVGDNTWNYSGQIGKLAELNLDTKSSTYPRELVVIANTFVTEGETACGKNFKADMEDTSFELTDKRSALEKEIAKKGALKGLFDYTIKNTVGVFAGDNAAKDWINKGIGGKIKEAKEEKENKKIQEEIKKDIYATKGNNALKELNTLLTTCKSNPEDYENITTKINNIVKEIEEVLQLTSINDNDDEKTITIKQGQFEYNKEKIFEVLKKINEFNRQPKNEITIEKTKESFVKAINEFKNSKFDCPNGNFEKRIKKEEKSITFDFNYLDGENIIDILITALETSSENTINAIQQELENTTQTITNKETIENIQKELIKMKNTP